MENFTPGRSCQTLLHTDGKGHPRIWLLRVCSRPRPRLLEMWHGKRGNDNASPMEIRNCYQSWSGIGLAGLSLQPLRCLAGFCLPALPATSPADRQGLSKSHFPAGGSSWESQRGHFARCPQKGECSQSAARAHWRGFPSPRCRGSRGDNKLM